ISVGVVAMGVLCMVQATASDANINAITNIDVAFNGGALQSQALVYTFLYLRVSFDTDEGLMIRKYFIAYTKSDVPLFHDKLIQHMESLRESIQESAKHKREYDKRMNDRMMQSKEGNVDSSKALDAGLIVT
ncbi:hypothetical protein Tco_1288041, partial [Tanacetum coccineum]